MVTACLDSPVLSVVTDDDCMDPENVRKGSIRTWRGTPSPALKRSHTIAQPTQRTPTQQQIKVLMPRHENGSTVARVVGENMRPFDGEL